MDPATTIFNLTMLAVGAMILAGAWFAHRALHHKAVTIATGLLGLGVLGVGIFPGNIHPASAVRLTAFLAGGLAVLPSWSRAATPCCTGRPDLGAPLPRSSNNRWPATNSCQRPRR